MRLMTLGKMAADVSNCGGFGQIAASGLSGKRLSEEIDNARKITDQPFGINIPLYRENAEEALDIAIEKGIKTITTSAGNPGKFIDKIKQAKMMVLHKVSTLDMALKAEAAGVDGVIATGFEAGGHIGRQDITTFCLLPQLADALRIPVIAAGGIADARGFVAALALGAEGVEIGTRFVATHECTTPEFFKHCIVNAGCEGTVLLGKSAMPIRVLRNSGSDNISDSNKEKEDQQLNENGDRQYVQSARNADNAIMPAGQIAGLIKEITTISTIMSGLIENARILLDQLHEIVGQKGSL
jgi:enoyl-[acyl-carrier protein] reductase II